MKGFCRTGLHTALRFRSRLKLGQIASQPGRHYSTEPTVAVNDKKAQEHDKNVTRDGPSPSSEQQSALSDRLAELTEEALIQNPRFMKAALASGEFNFNAELKQKLEERIASAEFKTTNAQAFATASLPVGCSITW